MRELGAVQLLAPVNTTTTLITGGWVDMQGFIGAGHREIKAVLSAGLGTTAGTCGGSVQQATSTAGAGLATLATFTGLTSAGGVQEAHGVLRAGYRYARYLGTIAAASDMVLGCNIIAKQRVV